MLRSSRIHPYTSYARALDARPARRKHNAGVLLDLIGQNRLIEFILKFILFRSIAMKTRYNLLRLTCALALSVNAAFVFAQTAQPTQSAQGPVTFSEECDQPTLDEAWKFENGADRRPYMLSSRWRDNVTTSQGQCRLGQRKESRGGKEWTSGHMWSKQEFLYGHFEARIKFGTAPGVDNAFWLMSAKGKPRESGETVCEIDIVEGTHPNVATNNLHVTPADGPRKASPGKYSKDKDYSNEFHVFAVDWTADEIRWFLDGQQVRTEPNKNCHSPLAVRLSTAVIKGFWGEVSDAINGTAMEVDYVRVRKQ